MVFDQAAVQYVPVIDESQNPRRKSLLLFYSPTAFIFYCSASLNSDAIFINKASRIVDVLPKLNRILGDCKIRNIFRIHSDVGDIAVLRRNRNEMKDVIP